jgi:ribosome-associated heat shock protein Hsp15
VTRAPAPPPDGDTSAEDRLDRWLWHARFVRTRTLSAALVSGGKVRVNGQRTVKPGHAVRPGDVLTVTLPGGVRVVRVLSCATRRGPAPEAQALYADLSQDPDAA